MTQINKYNYTESQVTALVVDTTNAEYLWVGFSLNDSVCNFKKVSANKPDQVYFSIDLSVTAINRIISSGTSVYAVVNDTSILCRRFLKTNPVTTTVDFDIPVSVNEAPVDALVSGSYIYFLTPGSVSGENAKILKYTLTGTYTETIELSTVTSAKALTINEVSGEFWIITYASPSQYIRVYQTSGGTWTYTINT